MPTCTADFVSITSVLLIINLDPHVDKKQFHEVFFPVKVRANFRHFGHQYYEISLIRHKNIQIWCAIVLKYIKLHNNLRK